MTGEAQQGDNGSGWRWVRVASWVGALAVCVLVLALAIAWHRWSIAFAVVVAPVVVPALWRRLLLPLWPKRWYVIPITTLLVVLLLCSVVQQERAEYRFSPCHPTPTRFCFNGVETVKYHANASLTATVLRLDEQVTVRPEAASFLGPGWKLDRTVNGKPVYRRAREEPVRRESSAEWEAAVPILIGAMLVPDTGSEIQITAPKGSLGVTSPVTQQLVDVPRRQELATVSLSEYDEWVVVAVRPPWLRNPAGRALESFFAWGPSAWLAGFVGAVLSTVVVGRATAGADRAVGRLLRPFRPPAPPDPPGRQQGQPHPTPRKPLRNGGARLLIRNPRRRL